MIRLAKHDELAEAMAKHLGRRFLLPPIHAQCVATAALDALLKAVVELEVGREANLMIYGTGNTPEKLAVKHWCADTPGRGEDKVLDALILRMEASDDK